MKADSSQVAGWLNLARNGDVDARNQLFESCRSFIAVIARLQLHRRLQSKVDPSDLVQQSMLDAHCGFEAFQGVTSEEWLAWLKQIVRHNAIDADKHYRMAERRSLQKETPIDNLTLSHHPGSPVDRGPSPSQFLLSAEQELRVATAIERLPVDYRSVVMLRNIERLSFDEVAGRLGRTRGACQMLWMRAIEQLRREMEGDVP